MGKIRDLKPDPLPLDYFIPHSVCPHCLEHLEWILPVVPLYDMAIAAELVPLNYASLRMALSRLKLPTRYRRDRRGVLHRMVSAQEIRQVRSECFVFKNPDKTRRAADKYGL